MEQFLPIVSHCFLFSHLNQEEILYALNCIGAVEYKWAKGETVFHEGDPVKMVGIVLSGSLQIFRTDNTGNRIIILSVKPGELFGEEYVCAGQGRAPASVLAAQDSSALLINYEKLLSCCDKRCPIHWQISRNMLESIAQKNILLNKKNFIVSRRTTQEKLLAYLSDEARERNALEFTVPFDRQALADYLGVERSAMSTEINKLKKSGVIDCKGSWFRILESVI